MSPSNPASDTTALPGNKKQFRRLPAKLSGRFSDQHLVLCLLSVPIALAALAGAAWQAPFLDPYAAVPPSLPVLLVHPVERNAFLRSGVPSLTSVTFAADAQTGWLLGRNGTILKSTNGGENWTSRGSGTSVTLRSLTFMDDGRTGWAVGDDGTVIQSVDSGDSWTPQVSNTSADLWSVAFSNDGQTGWAVGQSGTIIKTTNGGAVWERRASGIGVRLSSVTFADDEETGLAAGVNSPVLRSTDAGDTWHPSTSTGLRQIWSVDFAGSETAWAVGFSGIIAKSEDAGESWDLVDTDFPVSLRSITFTANGQVGWAVGTAGAILRSNDRGERWESLPRSTSSDLMALAFPNGGSTGWAVGPGTILSTQRGDEIWQTVTYAAYPAPWVGVVLLVAVLMVLVPLATGAGTVPNSGKTKPPPAGPTDEIRPESKQAKPAEHFFSDQPIADAGQDVLNRGYIAVAISKFLRNESTEPPLTIALTGGWGQGKSSLMNLLKAHLSRHGAETVWFNAWHHQKEDHLFAALMQAVREQAIPSWLTGPGLRFRWRLFLLRMRRRRTLELPIVIALALMGAFVVVALYPNCGRVAAVVPGLYLLMRIAHQAFVRLPNPGRLARVAYGLFRVKAFGDQLAFRQQFADAFCEVAQALKPYRMLILIDDLDRCQPAQVVETLEAVNFLVNAGQCYVVMGFAPAQVMSCVGLGFKDIAEEMPVTSGNGSHDSRLDEQRRKRRREYARQYMEKLVNIEVSVPELARDDPQKLIGGLGDEQRTAGNAGRVFGRITNLLAIAISILFVLMLYFEEEVPPQPVARTGDQRIATTGPSQVVVSEESFTETARLPVTEEGPEAPLGGPSTAQTSLSGAAEQSRTEQPVIGNRSDGGVDPVSVRVSGWYLAAVLLVFAVTIASTVYWLRRKLGSIEQEMLERDVTKDSRDFEDALEIWYPVVTARVNSPREIKRFVNAVRYFAVACNESGRQELGLSESAIVALAAVQRLTGEAVSGRDGIDTLFGLADVLKSSAVEEDLVNWKRNVTRELGAGSTELEQQISRSTVDGRLENAVTRHRARFGEDVTREMIERFIGMSRGLVVR